MREEDIKRKVSGVRGRRCCNVHHREDMVHLMAVPDQSRNVSHEQYLAVFCLILLVW